MLRKRWRTYVSLVKAARARLCREEPMVSGTTGSREYVFSSSQDAESSQNAHRLRVMSYNILADCLATEHCSHLYRSQPRWLLKWEHRCHQIAREIRQHRPDILCLQEVDHFPFFRRELGRLGYHGHYLKRTGSRRDGLAMFWLQSKFARVEMEELRFIELGLKDNVAQVAMFELRNESGPEKGEGQEQEATCHRVSHDTELVMNGCSHDNRHHNTALPSSTKFSMKENGAVDTLYNNEHHSTTGGSRLVVGNIHVLFNPRRGDIKLAQVRTLLRALCAAAVRSAPTSPCIACGDFNSVQGSAIHRFIADGRLPLQAVDRRHASGQVEGSGWGWERMREALLGGVGLDRRSSSRAPQWSEAELAIVHGRKLAENEELELSLKEEEEWDSCDGFETTQEPGALQSGVEIADQNSRDQMMLRHPLKLRSAYAAVTGEEPLWTTCHDAYMGTVDFLWFGGPRRHSGSWRDRLVPRGVLLPPNPNGLTMGLPSGQWPSDHISLVVDFDLLRESIPKR